MAVALQQPSTKPAVIPTILPGVQFLMSVAAQPKPRMFAGAEDQSFASTMRFLAIVIAILPPLLILTLINKDGMNIPLRDQWSEIDFYIKAVKHQIGFSDLLMFHNEHRMVVSKAFLALTAWNGWDTVREMKVSLFFAVTALACVGALAWNTKSKWTWLMVPMASLLMFSDNQFDNWLWGWQMAWFIALACTCGSILALEKIKNNAWALTTSGVLCLLATYSIASAIVSGLAVAFYLVLRKDRFKWAWLGAGVLTVANAYLYRFGYRPDMNPYAAPPPATVALPFVAKNLLIGLGKPFATPANLDKRTDIYNFWWGGAAVLTLALSWWAGLRKDKAEFIKQASPWAAFTAFGVMFVALTLYGRVQNTEQFGFIARYIVFVNLFWIGVLGTGIAAAKLDPRMRWVIISLSVVMVGRLAMIHPEGEKLMTAQSEVGGKGQLAMIKPCDSKVLLPMHANHREIVDGCFKMAENRIGLFDVAK